MFIFKTNDRINSKHSKNSAFAVDAILHHHLTFSHLIDSNLHRIFIKNQKKK